MSLFRIAFMNDKAGAYKKTFYRVKKEGFNPNSPYLKDLYQYLFRYKGVFQDEKFIPHYLLSREVAIVTSKEIVGIQLAMSLIGMALSGDFLPMPLSMDEETYEEEEDDDDDYDYDYEFEDYDDEEREREEEELLRNKKEIEYINLSESLNEVGSEEVIKRLSLHTEEEVLILGGYQKGLRLEEEFLLTEGIQARLKVMVVSPEVVRTKEFNRLMIEKKMDVIWVGEVGEDYYREYFEENLKKYKFKLSEEEITFVFGELKRIFRFNLCEEVIINLISEVAEKKRAEEEKKERDYLYFIRYFTDYSLEKESEKEKLNKMIGLQSFKGIVDEILAVEYMRKYNKKLETPHRNMIFSGRPGTGKTMSAKLLGNILVKEGICKSNFTIATREDLIGKYIGHTAPKISELFQKSREGVIFVDEAGFFVNKREGDSYLQEAIKEFVRFMEEFPDVIVIFAMYDEEVEEFLALDRGLASRISRIVEFPDYTKEELLAIVLKMFQDKGYEVKKQGKKKLESIIEGEMKKDSFGNGRTMRKIVEKAISNQCLRMYRKKEKEKEELFTIKEEDIDENFGEIPFLLKKKKEGEDGYFALPF